MIMCNLLQKLEFDKEDIEYILESHKKYGDKIAPLSVEFMQCGKAGAEWRAASAEAVQKAVEAVPHCDNQYILQLLFWLYCVPFAEEYYDSNKISKEVFYDTMKDLSCKTRECKEVHGKIGIYAPWFYLHFSYVYFALGRLQYHIGTYNHDTYFRHGYVISPGDRIYSCHIPSGSKLTPEKCMESFQKAYEFFENELKDDILPLMCDSWLLYPPYVEKIFLKDSNMEKFAKMFDLIGKYETGRKFSECESVFGVRFEGSTEGFLCDNSLRRNFIDYMNSGEESGKGIGIILYDGKKKEIVR